MSLSKIKYLCKKDIKIGFRIGQAYIMLGILLPLMLFAAPIYILIDSSESIKYITSFIISYIPFFFLYIILFTGNTIIQKIIVREKNNKTTIPLLCAGMTPKEYWLAKLLSVFIITFCISLMIIIIILILLVIFTPGLLFFRLPILLLQILTTILFSLVFVGINIFLYMISLKSGIISMLIMVMPLFILPFLNKIEFLQNQFYMLGAGLLCLILLVVMANMVNKISRERLSGIFEII